MRTRLAILLFALLLLLPLVLTATAGDLETHYLPQVQVNAQSVCRVTLFEDGSWYSPDYRIGEPWPPPCQFVITDSDCQEGE